MAIKNMQQNKIISLSLLMVATQICRPTAENIYSLPTVFINANLSKDLHLNVILLPYQHYVRCASAFSCVQ